MPEKSERQRLIQEGMSVLRDAMNRRGGWTPSRDHPIPPWENPYYVDRLGYTRIAAAFVDAGWTPPSEPKK
jgi:hypothetical protein